MQTLGTEKLVFKTSIVIYLKQFILFIRKMPEKIEIKNVQLKTHLTLFNWFSWKSTKFSKESGLSAYQLCLANCPFDERLDYKLALSGDDHWPPPSSAAGIWDSPSAAAAAASDVQPTPRLRLDQAAALCRQANLTDFFFDACAFDLMVSGGDLTFRWV